MPPAPAVFSRCSSQPSLSASASRDRLARARDRLADVALLGRAGVQDDAARRRSPARRAASGSARRAILARMSRSSLGAVEQVDGVDQHGVDRAVGHRLAEGGDVLVAVVRRLPHARRLVEDLDRPAAALDAALDRLAAGRPRARRGRRSACGRIMRASLAQAVVEAAPSSLLLQVAGAGGARLSADR